jgi:hypothetical protein
MGLVRIPDIIAGHVPVGQWGWIARETLSCVGLASIGRRVTGGMRPGSENSGSIIGADGPVSPSGLAGRV